MELVHNPATPVSFMSTDILLIKAVTEGWVTIEDIVRLRPNSKTVTFSVKHENESVSRHEYVMDTMEFIHALRRIENYHFEF